MKCVLCGQRKGRRQCPARGALICSHCCGSKRRIEIACPQGCVYLDGAHAPDWDGRVTEAARDRRRVLPHLQSLSEAQQGLFFVALIGLRGLALESPGLDDRLLGAALSALRKTVETRMRGVIYEHAPEDARALALVGKLSEILRPQDESGRAAEPRDADVLPVLQALEAILTAASSDPSQPRSFLELAVRLTAGAGAKPEPAPRILV